MVLRKKNLLDAFRQAAPDRPQASPGSSSSASGPGGPFAPRSPDSIAPASSEPRSEPRAPATPASSTPDDLELERLRGSSSLGQGAFERALADRTLRGVLIVAVLVAVGAWFAGRSTRKPTQAASPASSSTGGGLLARSGEGASGVAPGADLAQLNASAAKMGSEDDRAFMDPANKFTVRLIQYENDPESLQRARETAEHLRRKEGLPIVGPILMGKVLVLCAGHAPRQEDLKGLLSHAKTVHGPPPEEKKLPFASAYVVNIDDVVKRR